MFLKDSATESTIFFAVKEGCKVSCVKLVVWSYLLRKVLIYYSFYIFEYGAEYGAECSAESGAKEYFIEKCKFVFINSRINPLRKRNKISPFFDDSNKLNLTNLTEDNVNMLTIHL